MGKTIITLDIELEKILCDEENGSDIHIEKKSDDKKNKIAIGTLAENIKEHGLLSPIIIYKFVDSDNTQIKYGIIAGKRRFKAYEMLAQNENKYLKIPAIIRDIKNEEDKKCIQLSENISRKHLTEDEKAVEVYALYQKLQGEAKENKTNYGTLGQKIGISKSDVKKLCDMQKDKKNQNQVDIGKNQVIQKVFDMNSVNAIFELARTMGDTIKNIKDFSVEDKIQFKSEAKLLHSKMKEILAFIRKTEKKIAEDEEVVKKERTDRALIKQQEIKAEKGRLKIEKEVIKAKKKTKKQDDKAAIIIPIS